MAGGFRKRFNKNSSHETVFMISLFVGFVTKFSLCVMDVLPACTYVFHMYVWCPWRPEEDLISSGTRTRDRCKLPYMYQFSERAASAL